MKKALSAALFGGVLIFFVPQAASGGTGNGHPVVTHEMGGDSGSSGCTTMSQGDAAHGKKDPPGEGHSHYDKEHHDDDAVLN